MGAAVAIAIIAIYRHVTARQCSGARDTQRVSRLRYFSALLSPLPLSTPPLLHSSNTQPTIPPTAPSVRKSLSLSANTYPSVQTTANTSPEPLRCHVRPRLHPPLLRRLLSRDDTPPLRHRSPPADDRRPPLPRRPRYLPPSRLDVAVIRARHQALRRQSRLRPPLGHHRARQRPRTRLHHNPRLPPRPSFRGWNTNAMHHRIRWRKVPPFLLLLLQQQQQH